MPIDRDAVIQAVVKEYGILLGKDDPILAFLAVHDVVLRQYSAELSGTMNQLQEHLELVTDRYHGQSKELAETIVGNAVTQIRREGKVIQDGLREMLDAERQKHQATMQHLAHQAKQSSQRATLSMWAALGCAVISTIAVVIIVVM